MRFFILASLSIMLSLPVWAGGPIRVSTQGSPSKWQDNTIIIHPEGGECGPYSNSEMIALVEDILSDWTGIPGIDLTIIMDTSELGDIDLQGTNYSPYFNGNSSVQDELTPLAFDNDGSIVGDFLGASADSINVFQVLGYAGPNAFLNSTLSTVVGGTALINCKCLNEDECVLNSVDFSTTESELEFTILHELGHLLGVDHSQVGYDLLQDNESNDGCGDDCAVMPTMFPVSVDPDAQLNLTEDDKVAMLTLYGDSTWENSFCRISGTLLDVAGNDLRCADIQAVPQGDESKTISVISGVYSPNVDLNEDGFVDLDDECLDNCGDFTLRGLDPSLTYDLVLRAINADFVDGSGINPCGNSETFGQKDGIVDVVLQENINCDGPGTELSLDTIQTDSCNGSVVIVSGLSSCQQRGGVLMQETTPTCNVNTRSCCCVPLLSANEGEDDDDDSTSTSSKSSGCALARDSRFSAYSSGVTALLVLACFLKLRRRSKVTITR